MLIPRDSQENTDPTVPGQPEAKNPLKKSMPLILILGGVVLLFGLVSLVGLVSGSKKQAPSSALSSRPAAANPQQVNNFQSQQDQQVRRDAEERVEQKRAADLIAQYRAESAPGPEIDSAAPMTPAQRTALYGANNPNAPKTTSGVSEAQAQAKQRQLARVKQHQDAVNSDTLAIDFAHSDPAPSATAASPTAQTAAAIRPTTPGASGIREEAEAQLAAEQNGGEGGDDESARRPAMVRTSAGAGKSDPLAAYDFDAYQGRLYRIFEGTVFEGIVTNHIDGGFAGPILIMLTTDYYSHDHQQLLLPQGTRLIGSVQSVNSGQQRKLFVIFHRAVCPDGFSLDLDKYIGLDPLGTTGLATKADHGYFTTFAAAAVIGGLGGLAQIGNSGSVLDSSTQIRNGISSQTSQEAEQILNHFLNRLPVITLKEGSRARVYIGRDLQIPSYAEHRVDPSL